MKICAYSLTCFCFAVLFFPIVTVKAQTPQLIDTHYHLNSLHSHNCCEANASTQVGNWIARLVSQSTTSHTFSIGAQFGFMNGQTLPPVSAIHHEDSPSVYFLDDENPTWTGANNIEVVGFVPDNFSGPAFDPAVVNWLGFAYEPTMLNLIDQWEANSSNPNRRYVIYAGWPDMGTYGDPATISAGNLSNWISYGLGSYQTWMELLVTRLQTARPGLDIRLHDVNKAVLTTYRDTIVSTIPASTLFEDDAPHGRSSWYFLAALAEYMELYGEKPPADFVFNPVWNVSSVITGNYQTLVDFIWNEVNDIPSTPAPVITFSVSSSTITTGSSTTLTWSSTNATACTASNGWSGSRATSSSLVVSPTATTTYTLTCTGAGGSDIESVTVAVVSAVTSGPTTFPSLQSLQGLTDPSLAYGVSGPVDFTSVMVFIDLMKQSRAFEGHLENQWGGFPNQQLRDEGYLDANGWPTSIPSNVNRIGTIWDWDPRYGSEIDRAGNYVMTYEGQGTFALGGVQNEVRSPGRVTFSMNGENGFSLDISATQSGNHLRNIKIIKEEYVDLYNAGAIFNPEWIDLIEDVRQIRFMNWSGGNSTTWEDWADMPNYDWATWTTGVPLEVLVKLANELGVDPWFNIPFYVNDSFVETYAEYVRDNLDPDLIATVEFSNEIWNFGFLEAQVAGTLATAQFGPGGAGWVNYYGKRASQVMRIWTDVFGTETSSRLIRAAGVQTDWPGLTTEILDAPLWQAADPTNYVAPKTYFDAIAGTTYFGGLEVSDTDVRNALLAQIALPGDAYDWNEQLSREELAFPESGIPHTLASLQAQKTIADANNLDLIVYEGGQHVHHAAFVSVPQQDLDALQDHLSGYVRSQQMADLYQTLWDGWAAIGDGPFMQFVEVSASSVWGSWGLRESLIDNPPRAILLDNLNATTPAWWENRGGSRFQQGRTVTGTSGNNTLAGTTKADYVIAGSGNDVIYPGLGDDGINGGAGTDTVLLLGTRQSYSFATSGSGYRVSGPDGEDYLFDVEFIEFDNGDRIELASGNLTLGGGGTPAPVTTFSASPTSITTGNSTTLTWSTTNATSCGASNGWTGARATSGSLVVSPTLTTTYTLTCIGDGGSDIESIVVTVSSAPVIVPPSSGGGGGGGGGGSRSSGTKFKTNQTVILLGAQIVKDLSKRTDLGTQASSSQGTIVSGTTKRSNGITYYQVAFTNGLTGWVPATTLAVYKAPTTTAPTTPRPTTPTVAPTFTATTTKIQTTSRVNLRIIPGGVVLTQIEPGTKGTIEPNIPPEVKDGYTWVYTYFGNTGGYVAREFLRPQGTTSNNNTILLQQIQLLMAEVQRLMQLLAQRQGR